MARSIAIPLLILAATSLTPREVGAASITYDVVNFPDLQNGYTVTGTITTNGATGTIPPSDITSWDITITQGNNTIEEFTTTNTTAAGFFFATPTSIAIPFDFGGMVFQNANETNRIGWLNDVHSLSSYSATVNSTVLWASLREDSIGVIATAVPEPSSAVLASIGAVAVFFAYGWSRHRRAQRRQAAA
jgi:hypothetical protein